MGGTMSKSEEIGAANTPIAVKGKKGNWTCPHHPNSYDVKCGMCDMAASFEKGRLFHEARKTELAFTYLKDGLTPEEANVKAETNYALLYDIRNRAGL
jgi:hypothetical protein